MTRIATLIVFVLGTLVAVPAVYSQQNAGYLPPTRGPATPLEVWTHKKATSGLSSNAALAAYRMENRGRPAATPRPAPAYQPPTSPLSAAYTPGGYAYQQNRDFSQPLPPTLATNPYYPTLGNMNEGSKPFAHVQRPEPALERYGFLLYEVREDPETGLLIWRLP